MCQAQSWNRPRRVVAKTLKAMAEINRICGILSESRGVNRGVIEIEGSRLFLTTLL